MKSRCHKKHAGRKLKTKHFKRQQNRIKISNEDTFPYDKLGDMVE